MLPRRKAPRGSSRLSRIFRRLFRWPSRLPSKCSSPRRYYLGKTRCSHHRATLRFCTSHTHRRRNQPDHFRPSTPSLWVGVGAVRGVLGRTFLAWLLPRSHSLGSPSCHRTRIRRSIRRRTPYKARIRCSHIHTHLPRSGTSFRRRPRKNRSSSRRRCWGSLHLERQSSPQP